METETMWFFFSKVKCKTMAKITSKKYGRENEMSNLNECRKTERR